MPPNENIVAASIDDYLLALADGIYQAQRQLSRVSIEGQPGQPTITYQLPRVDFEFRVTFALSEGASGEGEVAQKQIQIRPVDGAGARTASVASTIKGSFVAVPAGGGKPPSVLSTSVARVDSKAGREYGLTAVVRTAAGEPLSGMQVQFNIDRQMSRDLSNAGRVADRIEKLGGATRLTRGVATTDARGEAKTDLEIDPGERRGVCVAVQVNAVDAEEVIVFEVPDV